MGFNEELEEKVSHINLILKQFTPYRSGYFHKISEAVKYSINAGGKRLRPLLLQECFRLCGGFDRYDERDIDPFICALEFIHTYSLVHDDLPAMDNDLLRRGIPTTHAKFGEDFGILAGDALLNSAYEIIFDKICISPEKRFAKAASAIAVRAGISGMIGGQCLDVELTGKKMDVDELDFIFRHKTGALIQASLIAGGYLACADDSTVELLSEAGLSVGMAFQIRDDILDCIGAEEEIGKPVGSDERNNKNTYVTIYGMKKADEDVKVYTDNAINLLSRIGDNRFLFELIQSMASRRK